MAHGGEAEPPMSWEDNRAMAGQAFRIHNAQYRAAQARKDAQAARGRQTKPSKKRA